MNIKPIIIGLYCILVFTGCGNSRFNEYNEVFNIATIECITNESIYKSEFSTWTGCDDFIKYDQSVLNWLNLSNTSCRVINCRGA